MAGWLHEPGDETAVVRLCGALTHAAFDRFTGLLEHMHGTEARRLVVDLSDVDFIDSGGIGMLLLAQDLAEQRQCEYLLRGLRPAAWAVLEQAHLAEVFALDPAYPWASGDGSPMAAA